MFSFLDIYMYLPGPFKSARATTELPEWLIGKAHLCLGEFLCECFDYYIMYAHVLLKNIGIVINMVVIIIIIFLPAC